MKIDIVQRKNAIRQVQERLNDTYYKIIRGGLLSSPGPELRLRIDKVPPMISELDAKFWGRRASDYLGDNSTGGGDGDR
jgi:hypothetical protein